MNYDNITIQADSGILTITLNRPNKLNALNTEMIVEIKHVLDHFQEDENCRVAILIGAGKVFCAGGDISGYRNRVKSSPKELLKHTNKSKELYQQIVKYPKPIIAAVHGLSLGGGCALAFSCDLVLATSDTIFGYPEITKGFVPSFVLPSLVKCAPLRFAFMAAVKGQSFNAQKALEWGLINRVVPPTELINDTIILATQIEHLSLTAVTHIKELFNRVVEQNFSQALKTARDVSLLIQDNNDLLL